MGRDTISFTLEGLNGDFSMGKRFRLGLVGLYLSASIVPLAASASVTCDPNAVICGGAASKTELANKIQNGDGRHTGAQLQASFRARGFTVNQINSADTVMGQVGKDGRVTVNGKVVATGAESVGRQNLPGSTKTGGMWQRPTSVSFQSDSLPAFVYMPGGQFKWAIITSCGNMVFAHPVAVVPAVKPTPQVTTTPAPTQAQAQFQSQTVIVNIPATPVVKTVAVTPVATAVTTPLVRTGASLALVPLLAVAMAGAWYHHSRRRLFHTLRYAQ